MTYIAEAQRVLSQLADEQFFGSVTFKFKGGEIVLVVTERTMLPSEAAKNLSTNGRTNNERRF